MTREKLARIVAPVGAVVEDQDIAVLQLGAGRVAAPRASGLPSCQTISPVARSIITTVEMLRKADQDVAVGELGHRVAVASTRARWSCRVVGSRPGRDAPRLRHSQTMSPAMVISQQISAKMTPPSAFGTGQAALDRGGRSASGRPRRHSSSTLPFRSMRAS